MADLTLNRRLNLVIPVETTPGVTVYVHSTPISAETFEAYFDVIAKTFTEIYAGGYNYVSGPRIAKLLLKKVATTMGVWDGPRGVNAGLIGEIRRLANVVAPSGRGWAATPLEDALAQKVLSDEDASEVENAICYFTVASAMHKRAELRPILESAINVWGGRLESLNSTELSDSLSRSTPPESTGAKATPSSIPS